jgi:hypothetical protein
VAVDERELSEFFASQYRQLYARRVLVNRYRSLLRRAALQARWLARSRPEEPVVLADHERAMVLWQAGTSPRRRWRGC